MFREKNIDPKKIQNIRCFIRVAREIEKFQRLANPLKRDCSDWTDDEWVIYIVNFVRSIDMEMSDEDMNKRYGETLTKYYTDPMNHKYYLKYRELVEQMHIRQIEELQKFHLLSKGEIRFLGEGEE